MLSRQKVSAWKTATIPITGADKKNSTEVDLGQPYEEVLVLCPAITDATLGVSVSNEASGTFYPVQAFDADATGSFLHATTTGTTAKAVIFHIGGARFLKIVSSNDQATEARVFKVRGLKAFEWQK